VSHLKEKAKEMLTDMVLIKSTSDDDLRPIVKYVSDMLRRMGLKPKYLGDKKTPAILAQFGKGGVVLSGHLDTVPHGTNWKFEDGQAVGDRVYGRGTCDMKGGCVAMLLAAKDLIAANVPFTLCFTTDEETTMLGAAAAAKSPALKRAPCVVVTEATEFDIVVHEKGLLHFKLITKGVSGHASAPELGDNAIVKMVGLLYKLKDLQRIPKRPAEEMTLCVDTITGGTRINVIPDRCEVEIDVRYPPSMSQKKVLKMVTDRIGKKGYELEIIQGLEPVGTDRDSAAVKTMRQCIGKKAKITSVSYATEMVMFKDACKYLMVCGPGGESPCHCNDEFIDVPEIVRAAELYAEFCSRMAKG
jgi:acetylornithine deacetylase/succinyl-diaminopimelate desuccinylase-like protein